MVNSVNTFVGATVPFICKSRDFQTYTKCSLVLPKHILYLKICMLHTHSPIKFRVLSQEIRVMLQDTNSCVFCASISHMQHIQKVAAFFSRCCCEHKMSLFASHYQNLTQRKCIFQPPQKFYAIGEQKKHRKCNNFPET